MTGRHAGGIDPLDGIDLLIFDKDGTLIEFHLMWGGWVDELADRLEARPGWRCARACTRSWASIPRRASSTPTACSPRRRCPGSARWSRRTSRTPAPGRAAAARTPWRAPGTRPTRCARQPVTDLRGLLGRLRDRASGTFAVATSDDRGPTERTLAALGIAAEFAALACADDGIPNKPAPDPVLRICASASAIPPERTAVVGDSPGRPADGPRGRGRRASIGVLTGVGDAATLEPLADVVLARSRSSRPA